MSELGLQPMSYVTRGGQSLLRAGSTDYLGKIQPLFAELMASTGTTKGWAIYLHPKENLLIIQTPTDSSNTFVQYALYTNTNAWTKLNGMPMLCGVVANSSFWFGSEAGVVYQGFTGYFDNVPYGETVGNGIEGIIQPAYSYFNRPGMNKHFQMVRPTFMAADQPGLSLQMLADYKNNISISSPVYQQAGSSLWDVALWDDAVWGGALNVYQDWLSVEALGYTGSLYMITATVGDTFLASIDYMLEPGGVL